MERLRLSKRLVAEEAPLVDRAAQHRLALGRQDFEDGLQEVLLEGEVVLEMVVAVVPFAELADEAALENVDNVAVGADERRKLGEMLQNRRAGGAADGGRQFVGEAEERLCAAFAQFAEESLNVGDLLRRDVAPVLVFHQEDIALHDCQAVVREEVQLVLPLAVAKLKPCEAIAANEVRNARHLPVLVDRRLRAAVEL